MSQTLRLAEGLVLDQSPSWLRERAAVAVCAAAAARGGVDGVAALLPRATDVLRGDLAMPSATMPSAIAGIVLAAATGVRAPKDGLFFVDMCVKASGLRVDEAVRRAFITACVELSARPKPGFEGRKSICARLAALASRRGSTPWGVLSWLRFGLAMSSSVGVDAAAESVWPNRLPPVRADLRECMRQSWGGGFSRMSAAAPLVSAEGAWALVSGEERLARRFLRGVFLGGDRDCRMAPDVVWHDRRACRLCGEAAESRLTDAELRILLLAEPPGYDARTVPLFRARRRTASWLLKHAGMLPLDAPSPCAWFECKHAADRLLSSGVRVDHGYVDDYVAEPGRIDRTRWPVPSGAAVRRLMGLPRLQVLSPPQMLSSLFSGEWIPGPR